MLTQSDTDATVPVVPWPVPGHQRLDAVRVRCVPRSTQIKVLKKTIIADRILNVVCTLKFFTPESKSYAPLRSVSLVVSEYSLHFK